MGPQTVESEILPGVPSCHPLSDGSTVGKYVVRHHHYQRLSVRTTHVYFLYSPFAYSHDTIPPRTPLPFTRRDITPEPWSDLTGLTFRVNHKCSLRSVNKKGHFTVRNNLCVCLLIVQSAVSGWHRMTDDLPQKRGYYQVLLGTRYGYFIVVLCDSSIRRKYCERLICILHKINLYIPKKTRPIINNSFSVFTTKAI